MYIVGMVLNTKTNQTKAVYCQQAGGCTLAELPRENDRVLRFAASKNSDYNPLDFIVLSIYGSFVEEAAAIEIAKEANERFANRFPKWRWPR